MHPYLKLALWIGLYLSVAFGIGQSTQASIDSWYQTLEKPSFNPPNWIFPIMWSFLYILIATAGWKLWQVGASIKLKIIYIIYTLLNWAWTPIFFGAQLIFPAFIWIVAINAVTILFISQAYKEVRLSALLMVPPLLWTLFAALLNYYIWRMNG